MAFQGDSIFWVEVEKIVPNPFQPRREFDEEKLKELAESVRMYGILQPLTVTRKEIQNEDGSFRSEYELIAGERRLRASKLAGVAQVPVIIREGEQSEQEKLELAIIENLQREDLNAIDRAIAFRQLADVFGLSHAQVAKKMGRSREYVSNSIRLLALPDYMLTAIRTGDLSEGHGRALLMLNDRPEEQDTVFRETLFKKLSVRDVERISRGIATEKIRKKELFDADIIELEKQFTETLGTRVSIIKTDFGGRLSIDYFNMEELEEILGGMKRDSRNQSPHIKKIIDDTNSSSTETPINTFPHPHSEEIERLTTATGLEFITEEKSESVAVPVLVPLPAVDDALVDEDAGWTSRVTPATSEATAAPSVAEASAVDYAEPATALSTEVATEHSETESNVNSDNTQITTNPQAAEELSLGAPAPQALSLRDKLALLLNKNTPALLVMSAAAPETVALTVPEGTGTESSSALTGASEATPAPKTPVAPVAATVDDSDLYSIRDFSI